nr:hypothetical protein [Tanacetum cinerariifolium]
ETKIATSSVFGVLVRLDVRRSVLVVGVGLGFDGSVFGVFFGLRPRFRDGLSMVRVRVRV